MSVIYYRRNQAESLSCEQLDSNWDAVRERSNHTGTQLASTISDLQSTVQGYSFITALQQCCNTLTTQLNDLQESIFGEGELSTLLNNLRSELLQDIAEVQADLDALDLRVLSNESAISGLNSVITSFNGAITGLQNSKAPINNPAFTGIPTAPTPGASPDNNQIATVGWVNAQSSSLPVGSVIPYSGASISDPSFVMANGQAISRALYPAYWALVGTAYGVGDGVTTFNVPNLQQRIPVGAGPGYSIGATGGAATHTLTANEMPVHSHTNNHTHTITDFGHLHSIYGLQTQPAGGAEEVDGFYSKASAIAGEDTGTKGYLTHNSANIQVIGHGATGISINSTNITTTNSGGGIAHNNMQPYIVLNYIVKVR